MADNYQGFIGTLNDLVQQYFTDNPLSVAPANLGTYPDKFSYIYADLIRTKGPDLIKLSNLQNYLSEWDRPWTAGGFTRSVSIGPVMPIDAPTFANGTVPNNLQIRKADVRATYHMFKARVQFMVTQFPYQLRDAVSNVDELGMYLAGVLEALASGVNITLYRMYKEIFHKYWNELDSTYGAGLQASLTRTLPATITNRDDAIAAVNAIRNIKTDFLFGNGEYSATGFQHVVLPERQRLYIHHNYANAIVDHLKLDHYMADTGTMYSDIAGGLSAFLGIPVKMLDDFGGVQALDAESAPLFPIFDVEGAVTGTFAATAGGTTAVPVASWVIPTTYPVTAVLTEDDFGNVLPVIDNIQTMNGIMGGGYTNTARYTERQFIAKPQSNTVFFVPAA